MPALPVCFLVLMALAGPAEAQSVRSARLLAPAGGPAAGSRSLEARGALAPELIDPGQVQAAPSQGRAFLSSLILPGLGQYQQGRRRWLLYAGVEVTAAALYLDRRGDGRSLRRRYRRLAWDVAREGLSEGPRMDGNFVYYETLSRWARSGDWDVDPDAAGLQPETDPDTFNGSIWALASQIFDLDPADPEGSSGYQNALGYYTERGYGPAFLWDWSGSPGSRETFGELIEESDGRFRAARQAVGILVANHLLSALDGLITARVARRIDAATELLIEVPVGR